MAKLFAESGGLKRAFLLMTSSEILSCKTGSMSIRYTNDGKKFFDGEIRIKNVEYYVPQDKNFIDKVKEECDFTSAQDAQEIMSEIEVLFPEELGTVVIAKDGIVAETNTGITKISNVALTLKEIKANEMEVTVADVPKIEPVKPDEPQITAVKQDMASKLASNPNLKVSLNNVPITHLSKKDKKRAKQAQDAQKRKEAELLAKAVHPSVQSAKPAEIAKVQEPVASALPAVTKTEPVKNEVKEEIKASQAKIEEKVVLETPDKKANEALGFIVVDSKNFPKGFFIGHVFPNKDGDMQVIMMNTPKLNVKGVDTESLPLIFSLEQTAKFVYESFQKHPVQQKIIGQAIVRSMEEFDVSALDFKAALVQNGLTFVNRILNPQPAELVE